MADKRANHKSAAAKSGKLSAVQLKTLFGAGPVGAIKTPKPHLPSLAESKKAQKTAPKPVIKPESAHPVAKPKPQKAAPKPAATKPAHKTTAKPAPKAVAAPSAALALPTAKLPDAMSWGKSLTGLAEQTNKLLQDFAQKQEQRPHSPMLASSVMSTFMEFTAHLMSDPFKLANAQMKLWQDYMDLWQRSSRRFFSGEQAEPLATPPQGDKRFKDEVWSTNPVFDYIKQSYLLTSHWMQDQVAHTNGLSNADKKKLDFYTRQFLDALSPTNFAVTNPQVIRTTLETGGQNLFKGLKNLLEDMEAGRISMTDEKAFKVGKNLAITEGSVVYRNELIELIQYAPSTPEVSRVPLLIVPPWINKFYILDLKPENSFIKWAVDQGLTVFCISWANPDAKLAELDFAGYMDQGILAAMDAVADITNEQDINVIGYCLGGTLLASTLAYLHSTQPARIKHIKSATYFTTMVDFKEAGELTVFIDEEQLEALEKNMSQHGYLDGRTMATTFNLLRANDLIWSFVVNNYLLGREPFPFDLLYWNGDSTRMPAKMHSFYLREMYQRNNLCKKGGIKLKGQPIDLTSITTPTFILSTREDHIAPWVATYAATQLYQGEVDFVLAGSGHIAGVVNPPANNKYGYWTSESLPTHPADWLKDAQQHEGSWWPYWRHWLGKHDGNLVPARKIKHALCPAPGEYVMVKS